MLFKVLNRRDAKNFQYMKHDYISAMISITDSDKSNIVFEKNAENNIRSILLLQFDDVEAHSHGKNEVVISNEDAKNIVKFVNINKNKVDCFVINCEGGVSRSAGCCAAIMLALTGDDSAIFDNPTKCPNMTVYRKVLNAFWDAGYFSDSDKGLSEEEIVCKEKNNIKIWREANEYNEYI